MLYATVRNRKISVKKPTTIPCNGKNVDFLTLDLDEDWDGIVSILCTFCNDYLDTKKQKKTVIETEETVTVMDDETVLSTSTKTDKEVKFEDLTNGEVEKGNTVTTIDTKEEVVDGKNKKTTTKTTTTVSYVEVSEAASVKRGVLCFPGDVVKLPAECVKNVGQLSVWLTGYSTAVTLPDDVIADPENFEPDSTKVLTMATPDSFWELVENGEPDWTASETETADLYEEALKAVGNANAVAEKAEGIAEDLKNAKASGAFNGAPGRDGTNGRDGKDGKNGENGVTFVPNLSDDGWLRWTNDGDLQNPPTVNIKGKDGVSPDLEIGRFEDGDNKGVEITVTNLDGSFETYSVHDGKDGKTPQRGIDYGTEEDKKAIVDAVLVALPNLDEVSY